MARNQNRLQHFYAYFKFLDETNAKILKELSRHGPRNISSLANATNLPITTVGFRLKKMVENGLLLVTINPNLPKLGLAKALLIADAMLGRHDVLLEVIKNIDYWTYIIRCYGKMDGYCAYFAFPAVYRKKLEEYISEASSKGVYSHHRFSWITNSYYVSPDFSWYDFADRTWRFPWNEWISEVLHAREDLPVALRDTQDYRIMADEADLLIIKELEKDAAIELKKLAAVLKITPQSVGNRYRKHVLGRNLIANYNTDIYPFPLEVSDLYNFTIDFKDEKAIGRFVNACNGKPFVVSHARVIGENSLTTNVYILKKEFPNLIDALNRLYSHGLISNFFYVTLDPTAYRRQTISYECFKDDGWTYDSGQKLKRLRQISNV